MNELFVSQKISSLQKQQVLPIIQIICTSLTFFANIAYMHSSITQFLTNIGPDHLLLIIVIIDVCIINIIMERLIVSMFIFWIVKNMYMIRPFTRPFSLRIYVNKRKLYFKSSLDRFMGSRSCTYFLFSCMLMCFP